MNLKTTHAVALCVLSLLAAQPVCAAKRSPTVEMKVIGIMSPGSCAIHLSNGGEFNYGRIASARILDVERGNDLGKASLPFTVDCGDTSAQVAFTVSDNRASSRVDGLAVLAPDGSTTHTSNASYYGLGTGNGKNLGAYLISVDGGTVDGHPAFYASIKADLSAMSTPQSTSYVWSDDFSRLNLLVTWALQGANTPAVGKVFTGNFNIRGTVNKASQLDLSSEVKLDGNATLTVYYL